MSLRNAAGLTAGKTVLIQGATGVAGRLAVKVARLLGAGRIVATGRDDHALGEVAAFGAGAVINTAVPDAELCAAFTRAAPDGYDVVLDFLWGRPTELLLRTLPESFALGTPTRLIQAGESAGPTITLPAESLRTSGVEICGAAKGIDRQTIATSYQEVVRWATTGELAFDVQPTPLSDIESAWQHPTPRGKRLVVHP
ncbi:MDR/zinc-dependent alcohol dehydrogenase-like family protein [Nocardia macrotermitis]|uniref:Uncharacterized protein n=1 Tax=Nocardia macrotermitis TaxID=2585198 RepID=A0A7K0D660_9NOCA|nr:zinc-binding dehydrogenase [Nocardia macrotermitis]MQY21220.1 hypothetical protein [Nocardia macrotermitis]